MNLLVVLHINFSCSSGLNLVHLSLEFYLFRTPLPNTICYHISMRQSVLNTGKSLGFESTLFDAISNKTELYGSY